MAAIIFFKYSFAGVCRTIECCVWRAVNSKVRYWPECLVPSAVLDWLSACLTHQYQKHSRYLPSPSVLWPCRSVRDNYRAGTPFITKKHYSLKKHPGFVPLEASVSDRAPKSDQSCIFKTDVLWMFHVIRCGGPHTASERNGAGMIPRYSVSHIWITLASFKGVGGNHRGCGWKVSLTFILRVWVLKF